MALPPPRRNNIPLSNPPNPSFANINTGYADVSEMEKYRLVSNIGRGSFGVISKVQRIDDGKEYAMKQLDYSKMTEKDRKQILAEVNILEGLKHRNIVQLVQKIKDPKNEQIYIVMEYCKSGDLGSLIRKASRTGVSLHEDKIWNVFLQITLALHHCHWPAERSKSTAGRISGSSESMGKYQVLHRDLKPENVFMSDDHVKLGDFGLSKDMGTSSFTDTYVGTPLYMPPEILAENRYDTKSDIWSLGCLAFEMCTFSSPFASATTQPELITLVKSGKIPALPPQYSPALNRVIKAMLNLNPTKRPSTKDLLEMDEMKLHRKLLTVQNQTEILASRKKELEDYETRLRARGNTLIERDRQYAAREAALAEREAKVAAKEEELQATENRLNHAAQTLRDSWDRLKEEQDQFRQSQQHSLAAAPVEPPQPTRRPSTSIPARPPLEERKYVKKGSKRGCGLMSSTAPVSTLPRMPRISAAWENTPSKIPVAPDSPNPLESRFGGLALRNNLTPIRRNNTKSLTNLRGEAQARAAEAVEAANQAHRTPVRPAATFPGKMGHRSSIGSPDEIANSPYCEDVSMMSYVPTPPPIRQRRGSLAPLVPSTSSSGTSQGSSSSTQLSSGSNEKASTNTTTHSSAPSMIPTSSFMYREAATPAKWTMDDPDLPSPFIRRASTAPTAVVAAERERRPLVPVSHDNTRTATATAPLRLAGKTTVPRSKSGTLHQQVLKTNAGRASGEGTTGSAVSTKFRFGAGR